MNPYEELDFLDYVHRDAPVEEHLEVLFHGARVAGVEFLPLYLECMDHSKTPVGAWKTFRRAHRAITLARYFERTLPLEGQRVECGVFKGFSILLLARIARLHDKEFSGNSLHAIDSFEGLSPPTVPDAIGTEDDGRGGRAYHYSHSAGYFATPVEHVRNVLADFPECGIHKGWIPDVFSSLPETRWSFVHIDVDLYAPTKAILEYFFPRLVSGGVILNDDFASPLFPGAGQAWHEFFNDRGLSYVVLDTGQAVYMDR